VVDFPPDASAGHEPAKPDVCPRCGVTSNLSSLVWKHVCGCASSRRKSLRDLLMRSERFEYDVLSNTLRAYLREPVQKSVDRSASMRDDGCVEWRDFYKPPGKGAPQRRGIGGFLRRFMQRLLMRADATSEALLRYLVERAIPDGNSHNQVALLRQHRLDWRLENSSRLAILRDTAARLAFISWPVIVAVGVAISYLLSRYAVALFLLAILLGATGHAVFLELGLAARLLVIWIRRICRRCVLTIGRSFQRGTAILSPLFEVTVMNKMRRCLYDST
jgi:hypothetical protein